MRRAFTLLEALLTLFLLLLALGILAQMFSGYSRAARQAAAKDRTLQALQTAMEQLRGEIREADRIDEPASAGASAPQLRIVRSDPQGVRFPGGVPWNPAPPAQELRIRYFVEQGELMRECLWRDGRQAKSGLVDGVVTLNITRTTAVEGYEVTLTMQESASTRRLTSCVEALPR